MASEHGMTIEARSAIYADAGMGGTAPWVIGRNSFSLMRPCKFARYLALICAIFGTGQACGIANKFARYAATQTLSARPMK